MFMAGEAALSVFFELFANLASFDHNFVTEKQVSQQLKQWQNLLPSIQAVLNDAEEKQLKDKNVKNWLAQLQHLAYDVDDLLEELAIEAVHRSLEDQETKSKPPKSFIATWFTSFMNPSSLMFNKRMSLKLEEITNRLNGIAIQKGSLGLSEIDESAMSKRIKARAASLQPMPLVGETHVYGRDGEKAEIIEFLLSNKGNENKASVIYIVGVGGIGKTTLAQLVYNDDSIKMAFDHKAWICVSKDFDATLVTKTILKSITDECCIVPLLDNLQTMLRNKLFGKRFLLVLDNVKEEHYDDLTKLLKPFGVGTKVIITTRGCNVSSDVVTAEAFPLQKLSYEDCLSVFTRYALKASDFCGHPELEEVAENIVKKCNGLPLAVKAIGGLLCTDVDYGVWKGVLESEIWDLPEEQCGAIPALLLSYHHLPLHLKRCFAYCSLLPKDYEFEEEEIILLWRAEGFLQQANLKTQVEGLGSLYFRELVARSFFQTSSRNKSRFVIHDRFNDLARLVAGEICFRLEGDEQQKVSEGTRHSSFVRGQYDGVKKFEPFEQMKHLRTFLSFMLPNDEVCFLTNTVLTDLVPKLQCLRVLSLKGYEITELPNIFENLILLRYLDFSYTAIKSLPHSICTLHNLQTLLLRKTLLEKLPSEIGQLVNLNHLDISGAKSMKGMPFGIGKLTNLQSLSDFILGVGDGHLIQEMKNLVHLQGDLSLSGLENIANAQDALEAKLIDKSGIERLRLTWSAKFDSYRRNIAVEEEVLNMLEPHSKLKELIIENYGGTIFPNWIADSSLRNLSSLNLNNCRNCKLLPALGSLPLLKDLSIRGMDEVTKVGIEFYGGNQSNAFASLERLCFEDMPKWKEWDFDEVDEQAASFPCLREFCIINCPHLLGRLPNTLYSLETLVIRGCSQLVVSVSSLPMLYALEINQCAELVFGDNADFPSLRRVSLSNIPKFCAITDNLVSGFKSLEYLKINGCEELTFLSSKLSSLRSLELMSYPHLASLESEEVEEEQLQLGKLCNVEFLTIVKCDRLERLPQGLHLLSFLTGLRVEGCPCLASLSSNDLPQALRRLVIKDCMNLQWLVDEKENTSISNVEHLEIISCPSLLTLSLPIRLQVLIISKCRKLVSVSTGNLPKGLKQLFVMDCPHLEYIVQTFQEDSCLERLRVWDCNSIKSLPRGLNKLNHVQEIEISQCQSLVSLTEAELPSANLRAIWISECRQLEALPNLHKLAALKELMLWSCSPHMSIAGFPTNLTRLTISEPQLCSSLLKWGLHKLTSLEYLSIDGEDCADVVSFPQEGRGIMLPPSVTEITISKFGNLRELSSKGLRNLTCLQELWIFDCPNLTSLPEKAMLLSLNKLYIWGCPLISVECMWEGGREWSKICHIPEVMVDHQSIIPKASWRVHP